MNKVLLADSDPAMRSALRLLLERRLEKIMLAEAADLDCLVSMLVDFKPELLLLDWRLPGAQISPLMAAIRLQQPDLQIVVLSIRQEDQTQALVNGAVGFIYKGDSPELVLEHLRNVLR